MPYNIYCSSGGWTPCVNKSFISVLKAADSGGFIRNTGALLIFQREAGQSRLLLFLKAPWWWGWGGSSDLGVVDNEEEEDFSTMFSLAGLSKIYFIVNR